MTGKISYLDVVVRSRLPSSPGKNLMQKNILVPSDTINYLFGGIESKIEKPSFCFYGCCLPPDIEEPDIEILKSVKRQRRKSVCERMCVLV